MKISKAINLPSENTGVPQIYTSGMLSVNMNPNKKEQDKLTEESKKMNVQKGNNKYALPNINQKNVRDKNQLNEQMEEKKKIAKERRDNKFKMLQGFVINENKDDIPEYRKLKNLNSFKENSHILNIYGGEIYQANIILEKQHELNPSFLHKHKIRPELRTKMVDWMFEVFDATGSSNTTIFLAVSIMDRFLDKTTKVYEDKDVHLIGVVCMFIASKFEDIYPMSMRRLRISIAHSKFSIGEIKRMEREIYKTIDYELLTVTTYDYLENIMSDLKQNNQGIIYDLNMGKYIEWFDIYCVFLAKLSLLDDEFSLVRPSIKAVAIFVAAYDIIKNNCKGITKDMDDFITQWISFILRSSLCPEDAITVINQKVGELYKNIEKIKNEGKYVYKLSITHPLPVLNEY